jgi:hypothetical protein
MSIGSKHYTSLVVRVETMITMVRASLTIAAAAECRELSDLNSHVHPRVMVAEEGGFD